MTRSKFAVVAMTRSAALFSLLAWSMAGPLASAQVTAPSMYTTAITVQGEVAGAEFDDWASSGIPVIVTDPEDNFGDVDIKGVQIANDSDFIYIHASTYLTSPTSLSNVFLAFDTDQNKTTGFDVLQIGVIGSEFGYQTDFPFAQYTGVFNLNLSITGGPIGNGGAVIFPYWTEQGAPVGVEYEWKIPLDVVVQYPPALGGPQLAIPNPSFDFVVYTDVGLADITEVISYTLASAPVSGADFDGSGLVDGADYLAWQRGFGITSGAMHSQGDADGNGAVNVADLSAWSTAYGGPTALGVAAAVPEPSAALLASSVFALSVFRRRLAAS